MNMYTYIHIYVYLYIYIYTYNSVESMSFWATILRPLQLLAASTFAADGTAASGLLRAVGGGAAPSQGRICTCVVMSMHIYICIYIYMYTYISFVPIGIQIDR